MSCLNWSKHIGHWKSAFGTGEHSETNIVFQIVCLPLLLPECSSIFISKLTQNSGVKLVYKKLKKSGGPDFVK